MAKLTLKQANTIIAKGFEKARDMKIKPLGIVVLDDAGHVVASAREDGATCFRLDVARGKAYAAVAMGASSRALLTASRLPTCAYNRQSWAAIFCLPAQ